MECFSVLGRRDSFITLEKLHKIFLVRKSAHIRNPVDRQSPVGKKTFGNRNSGAVHVCKNRISGIFFKDIGQISRVVSELRRYGCHTERLVIMGPDPFYDIKNMDRHTGIQKTVDLERLVCHFHKQQI